MNADEAREYVRRHNRGVLATIKRDGRPQLSNVSYALDDNGAVTISVTADRAKTMNLRRDPRACMTVVGENWFEYVVIEGRARFLDGDAQALRDVYRRIAGKDHPDWSEYDAAMLRDKRLVLAIDIEKMYPLDQ